MRVVRRNRYNYHDFNEGKASLPLQRCVSPGGSRLRGRLNKKRLLAVFMVIISICLLTVIVRQSFQARRINARLAALEEKAALYEEENRQLVEEAYMLNDPEYIELLARRRLGMVRPGEIIFQPVR